MPQPGERLLVLGFVFVLVLNQVLYGANRNDIALGFSAVYGLGLLGMVLTSSWARADIARGRLFGLPALLMGLTIGFALLSLTVFGPQGGHSAWREVAAPSATAIDRTAVLISIAKLLGLSCAFGLGLLCGARSQRARSFLTVLTGALGLYAVGAIVAYIVVPGFSMGVAAHHSNRLTASFLSANSAAALFGVSLVLAVALSMWLRPARIAGAPLQGGPATGLVLAMILGTALILTAGRSAIVSTAAGAAAFVVWTWALRDTRARLTDWKVTASLLAGLGVVFAMREGFLADRMGRAEVDLDTRLEIWATHWQAFTAAPWQGYGLGSFDSINKLVQTGANYDVLWRIRAAHNVYLQWLEEAGILGAAPMFLCIGVIMLRLLLGGFGRGERAIASRAIFGASLVLLFHGVTDFSLQVPSIASLWAALLGVGYGAAITPKHALEDMADNQPDTGPERRSGQA